MDLINEGFTLLFGDLFDVCSRETDDGLFKDYI